MKRENLFLIVNSIILLVIGIGVILAFSLFVPKNPEDLLFGQAVTLGEAEVVQNVPAFGNYSIVNTVQTAYSVSGDELGVVYTVKAVYTYFQADHPGYIELLIGIDNNNKVTVQIVDLDQTATYNSGIQNYVYEYFQGFGTDQLILIPVINLEDLDAGVTASRSTGMVKELVTKAIEYHVNQTLSISEVNQG
jgi:hypothetical protein